MIRFVVRGFYGTKNVNKDLHIFEQCIHELTVSITLQSGWTKKQNISGRKRGTIFFSIFLLIKQKVKIIFKNPRTVNG